MIKSRPYLYRLATLGLPFAICVISYNYAGPKLTNWIFKKFPTYKNKAYRKVCMTFGLLINSNSIMAPFVKEIIELSGRDQTQLSTFSLDILSSSLKLPEFALSEISKLEPGKIAYLFLHEDIGSQQIENYLVEMFNSKYKDIGIQPHDIENKLYEFLTHLPISDLSGSDKFYADFITQNTARVLLDNEAVMYPSFEDNFGIKIIGIKSFDSPLYVYLRTLVYLSKNEEYSKQIIKSNILDYVCILALQEPNDEYIARLVLILFQNITSNKMAFEKIQFEHCMIQVYLAILRKLYMNQKPALNVRLRTILVNVSTHAFTHFKYNPSLILVTYPSVDHDLDIILVHGISGRPYKSWRITKNDNKIGDIWPTKFLSEDIHNLRILAVTYESEFTKWRQRIVMDNFCVENEASELLKSLPKAHVGDKPIVWLCHSIGGLIIIDLLTRDCEPSQHLAAMTKGLVFFSTPHKGSPDAAYLRYMFPSININQVHPDSVWVKELNSRLVKLVEEYSINCLSYGESEPTSLHSIVNRLIVPSSHSDPGVGKFYIVPNTNHSTICKFSNKDDPVYQQVKQLIIDAF